MARKSMSPEEQKEKLKSLLDRSRESLKMLENRLSDLDKEREKLIAKIKEKKSDVARYEALTRESQYSVLDEMLRLKGVSIEEVTKAIAKGDMKYLLELTELKAGDAGAQADTGAQNQAQPVDRPQQPNSPQAPNEARLLNSLFGIPDSELKAAPPQPHPANPRQELHQKQPQTQPQSKNPHQELHQNQPPSQPQPANPHQELNQKQPQNQPTPHPNRIQPANLTQLNWPQSN